MQHVVSVSKTCWSAHDKSSTSATLDETNGKASCVFNERDSWIYFSLYVEHSLLF
jgi:hypothetical protein